MFNRKLLLITLLTVVSMFGLMAQNAVHVHGTITNTNGSPQNNVNVLVSAFFADSSAVLFSLFSDSSGTYEVDIFPPGPNLFGSVDVSMVDCNGTTISQQFVIINGNEDFQADFVYCENIMVDSCAVIILQEWNPGGGVELIAWTPAGFDVTYAWTTGETTQSIFPQSSGSYCVVASFASGCAVTDCIEVSLDSSGNCFTYIVSTVNSDGTYTLEAISSGIAPFTYLWSTGETTSTIANLSPGTYCVTTADAEGCTYTSCIIVDDFNFCEVYIYEEPNGGLVAQGYGLPPVYYIWSTGDSSQVIYPNTPGLYCVTMYDNNGCSSSSCYDYGWFQDSCYVYVNAFLLDSTILALQAIGSTSADSVSFLWNTGETTEIIYPQDPTQTYCVTMTDSDGCISSGCFESSNWCYAWIDLQYIDTATAVLTVWSDPIFQWPGSDTTTYFWSNGATTPVLTVTESGEYCVTVTLGSSCVTEACTYVDFENLGTECSSWVVQYPDSSGQWYAEVYAWGWGTFEYAWSNGDTTAVTLLTSPNESACVTVTSSFGCESIACVDTFFSPCQSIISVGYLSDSIAILTASTWNDPNQGATYQWNTGETGPTIVVSIEGTYCVTTYAGGCVSETCVDVYFNTQAPCGVWISEEGNPIGVAFTANAWGVPPFNYLWSNGDTQQTTIIDFGIMDLCVTVTDANGCVSSGCNYPVDSCYVGIYYTDFPTSYIYVESFDPLATVIWSTGDTLPWLEITMPGTYCATVNTIYGCETTNCITIDSVYSAEGQNIISGFVYGDTLSALEGFVYAYTIEANNEDAFILADSALIDTSGYYYIDGLADGAYLLKAELTPGSGGAEDFVPTYHYNSATWETANAHILPNWLPVTTDIYMIRSTDMSGGGVIGGVITDPNHFLAGENAEVRGLAGLHNVEVLLRDAQGQPLAYTLSLEDGSFRFTDLPWGTYRVRFDIPGLISPDIWVTLSAENPERLQVNLIVNNGTVAVNEPSQEEINLYPNPAGHEINMEVPGINAIYNIRMIDMQGKVVYAGSARNLNGVLTVGINSYPPGLYLIQLKGEQESYYGRFIKQD